MVERMELVFKFKGGGVYKKNDEKSVLAPCKPGGVVTEVDYDSKEAVCRCSVNPEGCFVDGRNKVLQDKYVIVFDS